ncbi:CD109 antigen-like [Scophthalmus maximus]|uniref:CD109 antigen-like n=1 Tax=Scophthalmus maximus TaxID=52904 RepID=UPI001FA91467|nr:CD109 antigen-like [Scophthalmus maximus]
MDGMWTLVVFFAAAVSTQDPAGTLFLISGPEVLHAGTPTSLAVTVFADFPGRVTAELALGDTSRAVRTEDFQGGVTRVLTLPPIPGAVTRDSLLNLTVRGYRGDSVIFANATTVRFDLRNVSTFVHTDRSRYEPGDTIRVRAVFVQLDNRPYKGRVDIAVRDPSGSVVDRWESTGNLGIVLQEFTLSQTAPLGQWAITTTTVDGVTDERKFTVEHHERPRFEVLVKTPPRVLVGDDISGSVRALYPSGQPVQGTLAVSVSLAPDMADAASADELTQTKEIYGSARFSFGGDQLKALRTSPGIGSDSRVHVAVSVTGNFSGFEVNKTVEVHLMQNTYQLSFHEVPASLRPSLHFSTKLRISRYDRKPLSSQERMHSAVVEVAQRRPSANTEPATLALPVPEDGDVRIELELQDQVEMLFLRARFQSSEETLTVYNNHISPSSSYIQISPVTALPAQIGSPLQIDVESTFEPTALHFVVSSRGQVLAAGTKTSVSFSLTPALSWSPEAWVTVYCVLSSGEVTSDTARIPINQHNHVSLNWSSEEARPGEEVSLALTALEPRSQVGIVVMGMQDDNTPEEDQDFKVTPDCHIWMLTKTTLYKRKQSDGPQNGDVLLVEKHWSRWMEATESLLWLDTDVSDNTWTSGKIPVPDGLTALGAVALVMSDNLGLGFIPAPIKLSVSKDFSLSLNVPSYLVRGEEIVLEVNVISHSEQDLEVIVLLAESKDFEFVLGDRRDVLVVNAIKLNLGSHVSAAAWFPIRPVALGEVEISVDAVCAEASDRLVWRVLVKPEGVEQSYSETLFLELALEEDNNSISISFPFPPDVVQGSHGAHVALVGDILALSFSNLDSLVQLPLGCGEQNMIHFAPSVYVLQYLDTTMLDDEEIRKRALGNMMEGYQRQLSYQRDDGSFSAFGASDASGSTWLTAFVLRCFLQAQAYMRIDHSVLTSAMTWLLKLQGPRGEFSEVGQLIHTEMRGGLDNGPVALTAYVLLALLEDETYAAMYPGNVSLATSYLENKVSSEVVSNYSLCLAVYALALANSPVADTALSELTRRADHTDGVMMWTPSAGLNSHEWQPHSAQIEMASYVLLALFRRASLVEGISLLKWLAKQRNALGGYGTTQDTVVAFQALSRYASFGGANSIDLTLNISAPASSFQSLFSINSANYRMYQSKEINADKDLHLNIYMEGRGFALLQMNIFYNVKGTALTQSLQHNSDKEAFSLDVDVVEGDHDHMLLSICMRLKDSQLISHTGMVILDVGMLSGFRLSPGAAAPTGLIRRVEKLPEKTILYLDSLNKTEVCVRLPVIRAYKVAHVEEALVQCYDYYEPNRRAVRTYKSSFLHNVDPCFFCGSQCDLCRPGITITVSSPLVSHSPNGATHSLLLSCIFPGVTAFLFYF